LTLLAFSLRQPLLLLLLLLLGRWPGAWLKLLVAGPAPTSAAASLACCQRPGCTRSWMLTRWGALLLLLLGRAWCIGRAAGLAWLLLGPLLLGLLLWALCAGGLCASLAVTA
jgi:hypothetical protein